MIKHTQELVFLASDDDDDGGNNNNSAWVVVVVQFAAFPFRRVNANGNTLLSIRI